MVLSHKIFLSVLFACLFLPMLVRAAYSTSSYNEKSRVEEAVDGMSEKFFRGLVNTVTGLGEIPRQLSRSCAEKGAGAGIPTGVFNGIIMSCVRTGVGVFEVVTFPVPVVPDDATPSHMTFNAVMQPEFVWDSE